MAYPVILRQIAIDMVNKGKTPEMVSTMLNLGINTVRTWKNKLETTGTLENVPLERGIRKVDPEVFSKYIEEHPMALDKEVAEVFGITEGGVRYWYRKLIITRKKAESRYYEANEFDQEEFKEQIEEIDESNRVYVDESGIDTFYTRRIGHSRRGKKIYVKVPGHRYARESIVAAMRGDKVFASLQYGCKMNSALFEVWFVWYLLPECKQGDVIVLDNASFHRKNFLKKYAANFGISVWFLPPYSPCLNPIEHLWGTMKKWLRNYSFQYCNIQDAIFHFFQLR